MSASVAIRASSLGELVDCPARWEAKHLLGRRAPKSGAAHLGTAVHAGTAHFDRARLEGAPVSADEAAGTLIDTLFHPEEAVDWEDSSPRKAEPVALALHARYCADLAPTRRYRGVELACEALALPELGLVLTGTTDRIRELPDGRLGVSDLKTGARAVGADGRAETRGHALQLGVYELLAEHAMGLPIRAPAEVIGMKTQGRPIVASAEIEDARTPLVGTPERPGLLALVARLIHQGLFYGNPRSLLCTARFCPIHAECSFRR